MHDVENASRAALTDVREAIRGYRSDGIFAELARARTALETAGVAVECNTDPSSSAQPRNPCWRSLCVRL